MSERRESVSPSFSSTLFQTPPVPTVGVATIMVVVMLDAHVDLGGLQMMVDVLGILGA
jgi:hypothetical protein